MIVSLHLYHSLRQTAAARRAMVTKTGTGQRSVCVDVILLYRVMLGSDRMWMCCEVEILVQELGCSLQRCISQHRSQANAFAPLALCLSVSSLSLDTTVKCK